MGAKPDFILIGHCRLCGIEIEAIADGGSVDLTGADPTLCDGCDYEENGYEPPTER
jgi:hypothetical protein